MKKILFLITALLITVIFSFGQTDNLSETDTDLAPDPALVAQYQSPEWMAKTLTDRLNIVMELDETQYKEVYKIYLDGRTKIKEYNTTMDNGKAKSDLVKNISIKMNKQINAVLTDDQKNGVHLSE